MEFAVIWLAHIISAFMPHATTGPVAEHSALCQKRLNRLETSLLEKPA
jgi:hypothetical protein